MLLRARQPESGLVFQRDCHSDWHWGLHCCVAKIRAELTAKVRVTDAAGQADDDAMLQAAAKTCK